MAGGRRDAGFLGRGITAIALSVGVAGCTAPSSMLVRNGDEPRYEDDDVAFRTIYYFRVFDACEGERPGFAGVSRATADGKVDYTKLFDAQKGPPRLLTDSLYRFRMTGKASTLGSRIHFESGTLRKEQIDPFGANVVFDKANSRFYFKSQEDTQADARRTETLEHIDRLRQLRKELESRAPKDPGARDQMAAIDQLILQGLNRLSPQGSATANAAFTGVGPETAQKAEAIRAVVAVLAGQFADTGDIGKLMSPVAGALGSVALGLGVVVAAQKGTFLGELSPVVDLAKDDKISTPIAEALAAVKAANLDDKAAEAELQKRVDSRDAREALLGALQALIAKMAPGDPVATDVTAAQQRVIQVKSEADEDQRALTNARARVDLVVKAATGAAAAAPRAALEKIDAALNVVKPWQQKVTAAAAPKSGEALVSTLGKAGEPGKAKAQVDAVKAKFDLAFKKDDPDSRLPRASAAAATFANVAKSAAENSAKARLEAIGALAAAEKPPAGALTFADAARSAGGAVAREARATGDALKDAAISLDDLAEAAGKAAVAVDALKKALPSDGAASPPAAAGNLLAVLTAIAEKSGEVAKSLRLRQMATGDLPIAETLPLPAKAAAPGTSPLCEDGTVARRGFQVLGPEGWRTFDQNERLIMAMSTSAKPLISTLNEISGRILNTATNPSDTLLPLMQERLRATEAKHRGDRTASAISAAVALQNIIDSFRSPTDPTDEGATR